MLLHRVPLPAIVRTKVIPVEGSRGGNEICFSHHGTQFQRQIGEADASSQTINGKRCRHWSDSLLYANITSQAVGETLPAQDQECASVSRKGKVQFSPESH